MRRRRDAAKAVLALAALLAGCGGAPISSLRFHNRPPITTVTDEQPIPRPEELEQGERAWQVDALLHVPLDHALSVPRAELALDVSSLDEVPSSSWFEPRIGARALTPEELRCGPGGCARSAALASARFSIWKLKEAGTAPGFLVQDESGTRYLMKIDPGAPEAETAAEVVVQRLLWAAGYHVPKNDVLYIARDQLAIQDGAKVTSSDIDRVLGQAAHDAHGRARVLVSEFLEGKPLGGFPMAGVRRDDPNDRIPHEHRRSVRALELFFAWLGQTDVKEANTLDMWVETDATKGLGVVRHHQLDFGKSLGVWGLSGRERDSFAPHFDYSDATSSLFMFGLKTWPWEGLKAPPLRGVGRFEAERFDPIHYSPANPYAPFLYIDRFDRYWAAKIIARFSPEHLAAAIEAGRYSDPSARAYLLRVLRARQAKVVALGFSEVSTLDDFTVHAADDAPGFALCARDLAIAMGFLRPAYTEYVVRVYGFGGESLAPATTQAAKADGKICVQDLPAGREREGYTMVAYETRPESGAASHIIAHLARDPDSGRMRLIGLERR